MGIKDALSSFFGGADRPQGNGSPAQQTVAQATQKNGNMENNMKYLLDQVRYAGFGSALEAEIKKNIEEKKAEFQVSFTPEFGEKRFRADLNFKQSDQGNYFFNSFDATLKVGEDQQISQRFYQNRPDQAEVSVNGRIEDRWVNSNFSMKEAFNMLEGRSVLKEFVSIKKEPYKQWTSINFQDKDKNGNFLLEKNNEFKLDEEIRKLPINMIDRDEVRENIKKHLERGEVVPVTINTGGNEAKYHISAAPLFRKVNVYDQDMVRLKESDVQAIQKPGQSVAAKEGEKADAKKKTGQRSSAKQGTEGNTRRKSSKLSA